MWGPKTTIWKRKKNWMDLRVIDKHHLFNENIKGRLYNGKLKQLIYRTILHSHRGMLITKEQTTLSCGIGLPKTRFTLSLSTLFFFITHHSPVPPPPFHRHILYPYPLSCYVPSWILRFLTFLSWNKIFENVCSVQVVAYVFNATEVR